MNAFIRKPLTLLLALLTGYSASTFATTKTTSNLSKENCPSNEALFQLANKTMLATPRVIGVSIALSHPSCGDFNYTFGESNITNHTPMNVHTKLPIASNTKPVILALTFMLMTERPNQFPQGLKTKLTDIRDQHNQPIFTADGKVNLTDGTQIDLTDPDFFKQRTGKSYDCKKDTIYQCPNLTEVDLHHLLLESSGFADFIRDQDLSHDRSPEILKFALSKLFSPLKDPGSKEVETDLEALKKFGLVKKANPDPIQPTQSHNTDAAILAIILERVSGQSLNELLAQKILKPLDLETDSMQFVMTPAINDSTSRRYTLLNSDTEIDTAIATNKTFPIVSESLAQKLKPSFLKMIGRNIYSFNADQSALDVLDLHGQGIFGFPGAGGMVAEPKAYIRFYQALLNGKLLSPNAQTLFNASFIPQKSDNTNYSLEMGYGSVEKMHWLSSSKSPVFFGHGGFVLGGESYAIYDEKTGLTMMVATNTTGSWHNSMPAFFVTPTAYFDKNAIFNLEVKYATLFNLI